MREEVDIEAAVAAGILGEDQALALRNLEATRSGITAASAERIEIASGVADIMSALGLAGLLVALISVAARMPLLSLLLFPALLWAGKRMTIERRLTASAFVLFFFYCVTLSSSAVAIAIFVATGRAELSPLALKLPVAIVSVPAIVTIGCVVWWKVTRLPVAVAAAWLAGLNLATQLIRVANPEIQTQAIAWIHLSWGVIMLAVALWWDMTDIQRETVRSRIAFWCHGAAGFLLATAILVLLAGRGDDLQGWQALYTSTSASMDRSAAALFLMICAAAGVLALLIDRRSLIFATMYHAALATTLLLGDVMLALGLVGAALVLVSFQWRRWRSALLRRLPVALAAQLPRPYVKDEGRRPTRRRFEFAPHRSRPFGRLPATAWRDPGTTLPG